MYRARDPRLDRVVAIKVLPDALAADPQFRERFDREARAISRLTHPHICTLYDVGDHAGTAFLVMEYLEGETLADRLAKGGSGRAAFSLHDALRIAIDIADALAAAHREGIIHRDLKPGNVMLTRSGAKLLDFGLAKAATPAVAASSLSGLPTTPPHPLTARGTILGTFHYMAPEQVEGGEADTRTDIFAFGCVLYEMLTGHKAFDGKTDASLIAAILEREPPPLATRQPLAPPLVESIVRKCLAKRADDRWQSAADLHSALRWAAEGTNAAPSAAGGVTVQPSSAGLRAIHRAAVAVAAAILLVIGIAIGARYVSSGPTPAATVRFDVLPPPGVTLTPSPVASAAQLALSPDGRTVALVATPNRGASQLWIRPLDGVQTQPLPGTEGASFPFWSPDNRSIAFFADGKLKKIDIAGGAPQALCDTPGGRGGTWGADGIILFAQSNSPISRISATGGAVTPATTLDPTQGVIQQFWPQFLPDGRRFLYFQRGLKPESQGIYVTAIDSSETTRVLSNDNMAVYASGHLLWVRDGTLFAQAFDERALQTIGEPVRVADQVGYRSGAFGYAAISASRTGVIAHGPSVRLTTSLRWRDRGGAAAGPPTAPGVYSSPRLSPDQQSVVVAIVGAATAQPDLWTLELARGVTSRVTSDPGTDWFPVWSPDGGRLFFASTRAGTALIFQKTGVGREELVTDVRLTEGLATYPSDASVDGQSLLIMQSTARGYDLGVLSADRKMSPFLTTPFNEVQGRFSPNGRWIAYASDESGRFEVYVRPFPVADGRWRISIAGGAQPEWRGDGTELFYISADRTMTAVQVTTEGATFTAGVARALFDVDVPEASSPYPTDYAVTADGQRFLVNTLVEQPTRPAVTVVLNWTAELAK